VTIAGALLKNIEYHGKKNVKLITNFLLADPNRETNLCLRRIFLYSIQPFFISHNYNALVIHTRESLINKK
jgi:hypothetical protein